MISTMRIGFLALALGLCLCLNGSVQAQAAHPASADKTAPEKEPDNTEKVLKLEFLRLPDGRQAVAFSGEGELPPLIEGFEKITLPDGRIAYVSGLPADGAIPYWATPMIRSIPDKPATWKTGDVTHKDIILTIPYTYKKTFRVKSDFSIKPLFSKEMKVFAKAGTLGFYSGTYPIRNGYMATGTADMLCIFNEQKVPFRYANCYLRPRAAVEGEPWLNANTSGIVPTSYSVQTIYGNPQYTRFGPMDIEDGDFPIDKDFVLQLKVGKWRKNGTWLNWLSWNGDWVRGDFMTQDKDGKVTLPVQGGKLIITRGDENDSSKSRVVFEAEASPAQ